MKTAASSPNMENTKVNSDNQESAEDQPKEDPFDKLKRDEIKIVQLVKNYRDLKNAGSSKIDKIVVKATVHEPVKATKAVSDKADESSKIDQIVVKPTSSSTKDVLDKIEVSTENEPSVPNTSKNDSGIDSSIVIISDEIVEKVPDDPIQIKEEFKKNTFETNPIIDDKPIDLASSPEKTDEAPKTFEGSLEFLNTYFKKGNEFISSLNDSIDLTGPENQTTPKPKKFFYKKKKSNQETTVAKPKEDTLFDMVKKRADDIRNAETVIATNVVVPQEPVPSTSAAFPIMCFNSNASTPNAPVVPLSKDVPKPAANVTTVVTQRPSISPGKRALPIDLSNAELSPVAKRSRSANFLIVNVINDAVPSGYITIKQERQIILKLTMAIDRALLSENIIPRFDKCTFDGEYLRIICADIFTKKWLERTIPNLNLWQSANLRVVNAYSNDSPALIKCGVFIPGAKESATKVFMRLSRMNPGLSTSGWRVYNRCPTPFGENMTLGIDRTSLANLKLIDFQPYYGLTRLYFQIL